MDSKSLEAKLTFHVQQRMNVKAQLSVADENIEALKRTEEQLNARIILLNELLGEARKEEDARKREEAEERKGGKKKAKEDARDDDTG